MYSIFLDESGQLSQKAKQHYFVVGSFSTYYPKQTEKQFRKWMHSKFPKKIRYQSEIKFTDKGLNNTLRLKTIQEIANFDIRIQYIYFSCLRIPRLFFYKDHLKSGHLYTEAVAETIEQYLPISDRVLHIYCDQRHLKGLEQKEFRSILQSRLLFKSQTEQQILVDMIDSTTMANIQIADWITGALSCYMNNKEYGKEYYKLLKGPLLGEGKRLF